MNMKYPLLGICLLSLAACKQSNNVTREKITYPETKQVDTVDNYFGTEVPDPYRWLEDDKSAETAEWVKAQNQVTFDYLSKIPYREALGKRFEELYNFEQVSAPRTEGDYVYFSRNSGLQNQSVIYRRPVSGGEATVFLDPNTFSKDGTTSLAGLSFSKSGKLLSYGISEGGSDWRKFIIMDVVENKIIEDTLENIKFSGTSWNGEDGVFYSTYQLSSDASKLSAFSNNHLLYYHKLGTKQSEDVLIFGDAKNPRRYVGGYVTENGNWLIVSTANATYGNDLYIKDLKKPNAPLVKIVQDDKNDHSIIHADDNYFYIATDRNAPNTKIVRAPINAPEEKNWQDLIPEAQEVMSPSIAGKYIFVSYLKDAITKVAQYDLEGKKVRDIELPGIGTAGGFYAKSTDTELYYSYTSYTTPTSIYKLDIESGKSELYIQPKVKFNPDDFESKQVFYTSKDGTKVPMIITHKKGIKLDGKNPTLLYGYGGFNVSLTPAFSVSNIILLENGGIYAVANLRGGGEYGKQWHDQGIQMKKQNVFDDFIAAAEYLMENKYTSKDYLAIRGGSNGGLLVGAVMTQRPDLCKVAFPEVGVLDMLRYHKFTAGAGWAYDYGTSEQSKEMFDYLYKYSPLHNLKPAEYPSTLVFTADHDDRVVPAHSFKFAATLQKAQQGDLPTLIRITTNAGHGAGKSTQQIIEEVRDRWSFMFYEMGITPSYK